MNDDPTKIDLSKINRILICILKYHGDVLLTSPIYTTLKRALPHVKIGVYLYKDTLPMLEGHPAIDEFITYDNSYEKFSFFKRCYAWVSTYFQINRTKYDIVINMNEGDRGNRGFYAVLFSQAKIRIGVASNKYLNKKLLSKIFTKLIRFTPTPRHTVERNYDSLRAIGIVPKQGQEGDLFFHIPESARKSVNKLIPYDDFILVHPTGRSDYKFWPAEKFAELIKLLRKQGENIVLSGSDNPKELLYIQSIIGNENVLNLAGKITLKELGALIEKSKLLVGIDSVPLHIASALKKPAVALFGPTDDIMWGPWQNDLGVVVRLDVPCKRCNQEGCGNTWISDCLQNLPVEMVAAAISKCMKNIKRN